MQSHSVSSSEHLASPAPPGPSVAPADGSVFVVDDDNDLRALLAHWLTRAGFVVEQFATGEACLAALGRKLPAAILMDLNMPGIGGVQTLQRIKAHNRFLPVLVLTVEREVETIVNTMQSGAYDFLVKPLSESKLLTTVRNAVESHRMALRLAQLEREVQGPSFAGLIGSSPAMRELGGQIERLAASDISVCILGESGTGKELVARAVHDNSGRRDRPFVAINCAAVPEALQESELFGHERGSFTGAAARHTGKFEQADGGTLFLDEVADLSYALQSKLLRVLQERKVSRVGSTQEVPVDFRLVAASHRRLSDEVRAGRFREDLYFRIVVFELEVPALRDREGDIALLATHFLKKFGPRLRSQTPELSQAAMEMLSRHSFRGNVRELENAIQRAVVSCNGVTIEPQDLPPSVRGDGQPIRSIAVPQPQVTHTIAAPEPEHHFGAANRDAESVQPLATLERQAIELALQRARGNRSLVAQQLGIGRTTLYRKLKEYGLK